MICPNCGVDIERFEQERAEGEKADREIAAKKANFQQPHGKEIRKPKKRNGWIGMVVGIICAGIGCWVAFWAGGFVLPFRDLPKTDSVIILAIWAFCFLVCGFTGFLISRDTN